MPVGVYRKKTKAGRFMYFRDGKLISKKSYDMSKARTSSRPKRARSNKKKGSKRYMRKGIPHPSVTGMASGLAIASYLNSGKEKTRTSPTGEGVIKDVTDGELGKAFGTLSHNAVNMIGTDAGRKVLIGSSMIALAGAFARSRFPQLKLGGSKLYFRV